MSEGKRKWIGLAAGLAGFIGAEAGLLHNQEVKPGAKKPVPELVEKNEPSSLDDELAQRPTVSPEVRRILVKSEPSYVEFTPEQIEKRRDDAEGYIKEEFEEDMIIDRGSDGRMYLSMRQPDGNTRSMGCIGIESDGAITLYHLASEGAGLTIDKNQNEGKGLIDAVNKTIRLTDAGYKYSLGEMTGEEFETFLASEGFKGDELKSVKSEYTLESM